MSCRLLERSSVFFICISVLVFDSKWGLGIYLFAIATRMALEPTQPPIQWVPVALSLGESCRGVKLTTYLH